MQAATLQWVGTEVPILVLVHSRLGSLFSQHGCHRTCLRTGLPHRGSALAASRGDRAVRRHPSLGLTLHLWVNEPS